MDTPSLLQRHDGVETRCIASLWRLVKQKVLFGKGLNDPSDIV
jgi:hypothetical protein